MSKIQPLVTGRRGILGLSNYFNLNLLPFTQMKSPPKRKLSLHQAQDRIAYLEQPWNDARICEARQWLLEQMALGQKDPRKVGQQLRGQGFVVSHLSMAASGLHDRLLNEAMRCVKAGAKLLRDEAALWRSFGEALRRVCPT